jgi:geranylgeranyl diphosphate synthase type II
VTAGEHESLRRSYRALLPLPAGTEPHLRAVVEETLDRPGRLLRAQVALAAGAGYGLSRWAARRLAVALEYFHAASLLFDDLPCMDDAIERRSWTCPHRIHGEAAAILGALSFVNQGYRLVWSVLVRLDRRASAAAAALVGRCLGLHGILNGQALDLEFAPARRSAAAVRRVAEAKTGALIQLCLELPARAAGVEDREVRALRRLGRAWGLGYQVLDDFKDFLLHPVSTGKTTGQDDRFGRPNMVAAVGRESARRQVQALLATGRAVLHSLRLTIPARRSLERMQALLEQESRTLQLRMGAAALPAAG